MPRPVAAAASACLLLAAAASASASILLAVSLEEMTARADRIVVGEVLSSEAFRSRGGMIRTLHRVRVDEELRGTTNREVLVETLGGHLGDISTHVAGEPSFSIGDEVVLFLQSRGGGVFRAIGATQGAMRIARRQGTRPMIVPSRAHSLLVRRGADGVVRKSASPLAEARDLGEFLDTVRAILKSRQNGAR
ncbi:MAG: hypothetical protein AAGF92_14305 [Myxococcota bacterium]